MSDERDPTPLASVPAMSSIAHRAADADLADAYAIRLPAAATDDPEVLARFVFLHQAPWVATLMRVRDAVMARFGVKTARQLKSDPQRRIGIFRIYERTAHEIILGEDDRHLDFRVSVLHDVVRSTDHADAPFVTLSTVVHCHNRLGRIYLIAIGPFHRMIVKSGLRRAAQRGWPTHTGELR